MADGLDSDYLAVRQGRQEQEAMDWLKPDMPVATATAPTPQPVQTPTPDDSDILKQAGELIGKHPTVRAIGKLFELDRQAGEAMLGATPEQIGEDVLKKTVPVVGEKAGGAAAFTMDEAAKLFTPLGIATLGGIGMIRGIKRGLDLGEAKVTSAQVTHVTPGPNLETNIPEGYEREAAALKTNLESYGSLPSSLKSLPDKKIGDMGFGYSSSKTPRQLMDAGLIEITPVSATKFKGNFKVDEAYIERHVSIGNTIILERELPAGPVLEKNGISYTIYKGSGELEVSAYSRQADGTFHQVGELEFQKDKGELILANVNVSPEFRRKGVATNMLELAKSQKDRPVNLSRVKENLITEEGAAFLNTVSAHKPQPIVSETRAGAADKDVLDKTFGAEKATVFQALRSKVEHKERLTKIEKETFEQMKAVLPVAHPDPFVVDVGGKLLRIDVDQMKGAANIAEATEKITAFIRQHKILGNEAITLQGGAKPIPDLVTKTIGEHLGMTPDDLLNLSRGDGGVVEQVYAASLIAKASWQRLAQTSKMFDAGLLNEAAFLDSLTQHRFLANAFESKITQGAQVTRQAGVGAVADAWKRGRAFKEEVASAEITAQNLGQAGLTPQQMSALIAKTDAATFQSAVKKAETSGWDYFTEYLYGSALSNPATHVTNIFGSMVLTPSIAMMERAMAARLGGNVATGEASAMLTGYLSGMSRAWTTIHQAAQNKGWFNIMEGLAESGATKVERIVNPAFTSERMLPASMRDSWMGAAIDGFGAAVRLPTTVLRVSDVFMKSVNQDMELFALATRKGKLEFGFEGAQLDRFVTRTVANPDPAMLKEARKFGEVQTFTNELEGRLGAAQQALSHPAVTPIVMFVRTPTNIFRYSLERTPGLNLLLKGVREDLRVGGARGDLARAKMMMGSSVAAMAGALTLGDLITGGGPQNPDTKKAWLLNHQPNSINVSGLARKASGGEAAAQKGDTWIGYNRADPIAPWMAMVADTASMSNQMDEETRGGIALAISLGIARNFASKTYTKDVAEFFNIFNVSGGDTQDSIAKNLERYLENRARVVIPAGVAAINRAIVDQDIKEVRTTLDVIQSRVPIWSKSLPTKLDPLFGQPISPEGSIGPDLFSPFPIYHARNDKVADELVNLRVPLDLPRYLDKIELSGQESHDLTKAFAQGVKINDMNLHSYLSATMASEFYQQQTDGPHGGRADILKAVVASFRTQAMQSLKDMAAHEDLRQKIGAKQGKRFEQKTGRPAPDVVTNPPRLFP